MLRKIFKRETMNWKSRNILRIFQHLSLAIVIGCIFYVHTGSEITGKDGFVYDLRNEDNRVSYEDSVIFNDIMDHNIDEVLYLISSSTLLENDGEYDPNKSIDVTAFVNRNSILQSDYITGVYKVSDLIKWSQNGFEYEERDFSGNENQKFLADTTVYTHLMKNNAENGMNSFLNSQLENNTVRANINISTLGDGSGTHTILIPRYRTVYDENIEDIVSSWDGYNGLCANITETASTLLQFYDSYYELKENYNSINSNFRYYVTRTINAKTEVYTNVEEFQNETNGVNVKDYFSEYGKYLFFCPYDMNFFTNTRIDENKIRGDIAAYDYAFPDQMRYYFAVDTESLTADDDFSLGSETFSRYMPYYRQLYALIIIFSIAYFIVFIHITAYEGHIEYADGSVGGVEKIDLIPIEVSVLISAGLIFIFWSAFNYIVAQNPEIASSSAHMSYLIGFFVFCADNAFCYAVYSIVRRIKAKNLYNTSLMKSCSNLLQKLSSKMTIRQNMIIKTVIPYFIAVFLNVYLILYHDIVGLTITIVMDLAIGVLIINTANDKVMIYDALRKISKGEIDSDVDISKIHGSNVYIAKELNAIVQSVEDAVNRSMRDEKMKADLITNVSHDIKTPLTSIINYVDLLKRENITDPKVRDYIRILDNKSQRLRQLTEDLVEASKISSGNITLHIQEINYAEIINQILGEFYEKFDDSELFPILKCEKYSVFIQADPRQLYRVIENLLNNVCKYAMPDTRVYLDLEVKEDEENGNSATFSVKNISRNELNIKAEELTERFIRGDISRSTEGSGLGLSIAQSLTSAMGGKFEIVLDGDLFKVTVTFNCTEFSKGNPSAEDS